MKPNNNQRSDGSTEQQTEQSQPNQMQPPEAAAKRDVQEAETKAERADRKAEDAQDMAVEEAERVHTELREEIEELRDQVAMLDRLVNKVYEIEDTSRLNPEMPFVAPENREPEDQEKPLEEVFTDE
jgi:signal transduction histidine kinase